MGVQFCSRCGKQLQNGMKFCPGCGNKMMPAPRKTQVQNSHTQNRRRAGTTVKGKAMMIFGIILSGIGGFIALAAHMEKGSNEYKIAQTAAFIGSSSGQYVEEVNTYFTMGMAVAIIGVILFLFGLVQYITSK